MKYRILIIFSVVLIVGNIGFGVASAQSSLQDVQNLTEEDEYDETIIKQVSSSVNVNELYIEDGRTYLVVTADRATTLGVTYEQGGGDLGRFSVDIEEGTTEVVLQEEYGRLALWDGNDGLQIDTESTGFLGQILSQATGDMIHISALGGGFGALSAVSVWGYRKKDDKDKVIEEIQWGLPDIILEEKEPIYTRIIQKFNNWKVWVITGGIVGVLVWQGYTFDDIPIQVWIFMISSGALTVLSYVIVPQINEYLDLWSPAEEQIIEIEPESVGDDIPLATWIMSPNTASEFDFKGEKRVIKHNGIKAHIVNSVDFEKMEAQASDMMSVPDEQMLGYKRAIEENRARTNVARDWAIDLFRNIDKISDRIAISHHLNLEDQKRKGTTFGGSEIESVLSDSLDNYEEILGGEAITDEYDELRDELDNKSDSVDSSDSGGDDDD